MEAVVGNTLRNCLLLGGAALFFASGYAAGHGRAEEKGKVLIGSLRLEREEERRAVSESYGKALAETLERYEKEVRRSNELAAEYAESRKKFTRESESLQRKIANAAGNNTHTFSSDFVRLYNEAIGISGDALPENTYSSFSYGKPGTGGSLETRFMDPFKGVSEADLLSHITRYGRRCRGLEAQVSGWQELGRGWK